MHVKGLCLLGAISLTACSTTRRVDPPLAVGPSASPDHYAPEMLTAAYQPTGRLVPAAMPAIAGGVPDAAFSTPGDLAAWATPLQAGGAPSWGSGEPLLQGFFGGTVYEEIKRSNNGVTVDGSDDDLSRIPSIGGGGQWKLAGEEVAFGLEGNLAFNWRANAAAIAVGGGGAAVAVDVDLLLFDLYGGPFVSLFIGDRLRLYGAGGPMMQWANYDQEGPGINGDGSGFGFGWYARTGFEVAIGAGMLIGVGMRWSDSTIDLDNGLGDLDLKGMQFAFTVARFY